MLHFLRLSIYVAFDRGESYVELDAKVVVGVKNGRIADIKRCFWIEKELKS